MAIDQFLVIGWCWEAAGGVLVLVAATAFFARAAGPNFVPFTVVTALPGLLWIVSAGWARRSRADAGSPTAAPE